MLPSPLRQIALALALCLSHGGVLGGAAAQESEGNTPIQRAQSPQEEAVEWYERGVAFYSEQEWQSAYDAFRRGQRLDPSSRFDYILGLVLDRLGRYAEAVERFEIALASGELTPEEESIARDKTLAAEANLAEIAFGGGPGDVLFGEQSCAVPCTLRVDPGTHEYAFDGERHFITIAAGGREDVMLIPRGPQVRRGPYRPGWGTAIGITLMAAGGAGTLGFGLHTRALEHDFNNGDASADLAARGVRARRLTNASIAVAGVGLAVFLVEVLVTSLQRRPVTAPEEEEARATTAPLAW